MCDHCVRILIHALGSGNPIHAAMLTQAQLNLASAGQCQYLESSFEEDFNQGSLNLARWLPAGSVNVPTSSSQSKVSTPYGLMKAG